MANQGPTPPASEVDELLVPDPPVDHEEDAQHQRMWGFADSGFVTDGSRIRMESRRYDIGGHVLPGFPPFVERAIGVPFDASDCHEPVEPAIAESRAPEALVERLQQALGAAHVSVEGLDRLRHSHGHHLEEIYLALYGQIERLVDVVVRPLGDEQIREVLDIARSHHARVIPYGGGTCVSMALSCPTDGDRPIVSLDLGRNNRIRWIDAKSRTACIEGGALGRVLSRQLEEHGFTLGHEPDSVEFSTLGGWIATNASGMKKNRYGNIEDIVLDVTVVTPDGVVEHPVVVPRASHGLDVRRLALGSEGMLGVITRATVQVHRLPQVQRYGSLIFPDFDTGLSFLEELSSWRMMPASVRLVDNLQLQFGRALKPGNGSKWASSLQKLFLTRVKGMDLEKMCACTVVYEGFAEEQLDLERRVKALGSRYGAFSGGAAAGKDGYNLTFGIAYIRDFLLQYWTMGDSFETAVPWGKVSGVIDAVKHAIQTTHAHLEVPGHPFVTARISQLYQSGCCIYFYIGFYYKGLADPLAVFRELEHEARQAIVSAGGALSHHHGIGKVRAPYLNRIKSQKALDWVARTQRALDPDDLFAVRNQGIERDD